MSKLKRYSLFGDASYNQVLGLIVGCMNMTKRILNTGKESRHHQRRNRMYILDTNPKRNAAALSPVQRMHTLQHFTLMVNKDGSLMSPWTDHSIYMVNMVTALLEFEPNDPASRLVHLKVNKVSKYVADNLNFAEKHKSSCTPLFIDAKYLQDMHDKAALNVIL